MTKQEEEQCIGVALMEIIQCVKEVTELKKEEQEALIIKLHRWLTKLKEGE